MTWGGTKKKYQNCNTRNWRYAPKGVFWCFLDPLKAGGGGTLSKKIIDNYIFKLAMGSCIKVVK
jgi:hypothetical protein